MKKVISIICILLILSIFFFINMSGFQDIYYTFIGNNYYQQQKYVEALEYHKKIHNSDVKNFLMGNDYYRIGNYKDAAKAFQSIEKYDGLYNAGNSFYRFGEASSDIDEKAKFWEKSIDFYSKSLTSNHTVDAEKNHEFVTKKLEELKKNKQEEKNKQEISEQEAGKESQEESSEEESLESQEDQKESGKTSEIPEITENEKASIEKYIDKLEVEERQNQKFFNKPSDKTFSRDVFDSFWSNFRGFDDAYNDIEKDW